MTDAELQELLRTLSVGAGSLSTMLPGPASIVGKIIAAGLGLAADFVAVGKDPIKQIQRMRKVAPMLAEVESGWEAELARKFGAPLAEDIYEDED